MCLNCKNCKWGECTFEDWEEEELDHIEEYDEDNCPHFIVYWAEDRKDKE